MACMSCLSGLFSPARSSAKQPEKPKEDLVAGCGAVDEEQPLTEPVEAAGAPADKEPASEAEGAPSTAAQADPEEPVKKASSQNSYMGIPSVQPPEPAEPEPAVGPEAPAHFEGSDAEDGKAARGCCVPRAGRRRNKRTKAAKHEDQEAAQTVDLAKDDGSPEIVDNKAVKYEDLEATPTVDLAKANGSPAIAGNKALAGA